jgi:UDP-N-acetylglucosamine 3-dehydrogenase
VTVLRAGLVGVGAMGRHHARILGDLDGVTLVGVADLAGDRYHAVPDGVPVVPDVEALLARGVDYVVIATPVLTHETVALRAIAGGAHVLVEKPLTPDAASAARICAAAMSKGVRCTVGHTERYNPAAQWLRARVQNDEIGEPHRISTWRCGPARPGGAPGVGVILDLLPHDIDLTHWILCRAYRRISARAAGPAGLEDAVQVIGEIRDYIGAAHVAVRGVASKTRLITVTGDRGYLTADLIGRQVTQWAHAYPIRTAVSLATGGYEPLRAEHAAFRDHVLGIGEDVPRIAEILAVKTDLDRIRQSAGESPPLKGPPTI